jgi:hypothetical protein
MQNEKVHSELQWHLHFACTQLLTFKFRAAHVLDQGLG